MKHLTQQGHQLVHLYQFPLVLIDVLAELTILIDEEMPQASLVSDKLSVFTYLWLELGVGRQHQSKLRLQCF